MAEVLTTAPPDLTDDQAQAARGGTPGAFPWALFLPGVVLNTSPTDHAPIEQEQLIRFDGAKWVRFGEVLGKKN